MRVGVWEQAGVEAGVPMRIVGKHMQIASGMGVGAEVPAVEPGRLGVE